MLQKREKHTVPKDTSYWVQRKLQFEQRLKEDVELARTKEATKEWRDKDVELPGLGYLLGSINWTDYEFKKANILYNLNDYKLPSYVTVILLKTSHPWTRKGKESNMNTFYTVGPCISVSWLIFPIYLG